MRRCVFLSMDDLGDFIADDNLLIGSFARRGWSIETISWRRKDVDWNNFDAVVVRSTWDYQRDVTAFLNVLNTIEASRATLINPLSLMRWNVRKTYLQDLEKRGVPIIPTVFAQSVDDGKLAEHFDELGVDELVLKPVVSATAERTFRVRRDSSIDFRDELVRTFRGVDYLAQPFMPRIQDEGEYSLMIFSGDVSHTILKTPKAGDFRSQEDHGGTLKVVTPEPSLLACAFQVSSALEPLPLYARADFVRDAEGGFRLMEIEVIEPALYFRLAPGSEERFATAFEAIFASATA